MVYVIIGQIVTKLGILVTEPKMWYDVESTMQ